MISQLTPRKAGITQDELQVLVPAAEQITRAAIEHGTTLQFTTILNGIKATLTVSVEKLPQEEPS